LPSCRGFFYFRSGRAKKQKAKEAVISPEKYKQNNTDAISALAKALRYAEPLSLGEINALADGFRGVVEKTLRNRIN